MCKTEIGSSRERINFVLLGSALYLLFTTSLWLTVSFHLHIPPFGLGSQSSLCGRSGDDDWKEFLKRFERLCLSVCLCVLPKISWIALKPNPQFLSDIESQTFVGHCSNNYLNFLLTPLTMLCIFVYHNISLFGIGRQDPVSGRISIEYIYTCKCLNEIFPKKTHSRTCSGMGWEA